MNRYDEAHRYPRSVQANLPLTSALGRRNYKDSFAGFVVGYDLAREHEADGMYEPSLVDLDMLWIYFQRAFA